MSCQELLDSLTPEQRLAIGKMIRAAHVHGSYILGDDGGSHFREDAEQTLESLALRFERHDPDSVLD